MSKKPSPRQITDEAIERLIDDGYTTLPPAGMMSLKQRMEVDLDQPALGDIWQEVFAYEIDYARSFNPRNGRMKVSLDRGAVDIARARASNRTIQETFKAKYDNRETLFTAVFEELQLHPESVSSIVEIGPAWGATTNAMVQRFKPDNYEVYEVDGAWARWLAETYGVKAHVCDGETLGGTADSTIDLAIAVNSLFFAPPLKQWSYLFEIARVLRPGGIALFNVTTFEDYDEAHLRRFLDEQFPKRMHGWLSQHCLDTAFPKPRFEALVRPSGLGKNYRVFRCIA